MSLFVFSHEKHLSASIPRPHIRSRRSYTIRYHIYDSQADRCFRIANKIISMFDVGGGPAGPGTDATVTSTTNTNNVKNRVLSSRLLRSRNAEPLEKEGWYAIQLDFSVMYVTD